MHSGKKKNEMSDILPANTYLKHEMSYSNQQLEDDAIQTDNSESIANDSLQAKANDALMGY